MRPGWAGASACVVVLLLLGLVVDPTAMLVLAPLAAVLVPLLAGRFPGEVRLARLAARFRARVRRRPAVLAPPAGGPTIAVLLSRLVTSSLTARAPPA